jgi:secreted trypsin-like serine protease
MKYLILSLIALALTACAIDASEQSVESNNTANIIEGTQAAPESPLKRSTVKIYLPGNHICSGVLLNDQVVLTAAHCVNHYGGSSGMSVAIPGADYRCNSIAVEEIALAPKISADKKFRPDVALLKLTKKICAPGLVTLGDTSKTDDVLNVAGFGDGTTPGDLDFVTLKQVSSDKNYLQDLFLKDSPQDPGVLDNWHYLLENYDEFSEMYFFGLILNPLQSTCFGDSGGPVFLEKNDTLQVFGLVGGAFPHAKKGVRNCQDSYLQFFAPVGPSIDWIQSQLKKWQ